MTTTEPKSITTVPPDWKNLEPPPAMTGEALKSAGTGALQIPATTAKQVADHLPALPDKLPVTPEQKHDMEASKLREQAASLPQIEDVTEFTAKPMAKVPVIVDGVLHQGSKLAIGGGSKSFKTWMMLDLALSVANEVPWLGLGTVKSRVLYCNFEIQAEFMQDRIKAVEKAKAVTTAKGQLDIWNLRGHAESHDVIVPLIMERIKNTPYGLIVIDPIYKMYGESDENSAGDIAALMNGLEMLAVKSRAAVVFGAHYSKGNQSNKESIDRVSGSGVFARDPDSVIAVTRHEVEEVFVVEATLRNFKPLEPFCIRWEYPLMQKDATLNPRKLKGNLSKTPQYDVKMLLGSLAESSKTKAELKKAVMEQEGMKDTTFRNLFAEMEKAEGVNLDVPTKKYSYRVSGQSQLS